MNFTNLLPEGSSAVAGQVTNTNKKSFEVRWKPVFKAFPDKRSKTDTNI
jgi:hypothetical protein